MSFCWLCCGESAFMSPRLSKVSDGSLLQTSSSTPSHAQFKVFDMLGGPVQSGPISATSTRVAMDPVSTGVYVIHVQDGKGLSSFKWIKE
jgi:hypothetical protein